MEWLMQLQSQVVGLDTAPLIYFIEQNETYLELVRAFFKAMSQGEFQVVTSTLTWCHGADQYSIFGRSPSEIGVA